MNKLICADAYEWIAAQPDKSVACVITDYPYRTIFPYEELIRICAGHVITFCSEDDRPFDDLPTERAYWIKTPSTKNYSKHLGHFVEHIHVYRQGNTFNTDLHWSNYTGVYTDLVEDAEGHQWRKPLSLMERLVRIYTLPGDVVLDPFCGEGTTLQACLNFGRPFIGLDNNSYWINGCQGRFWDEYQNGNLEATYSNWKEWQKFENQSLR